MIVTVLCPAKINSFLSVGPVDPTGYHPIRSVMRTVSLFDELRIQDSPLGQDEIVSGDFELPGENTLTKTLRFLRELVPVPPLRIELTKRIPAESGLGGGSSDAAGLLRALERAGLSVGEQMIREVAFAVGADVPFFLTGGAAIVEGYGERVLPLVDQPTWELIIVRPEIGTETKGAYAALDQHPRPFAALPDDLSELYNDFERVAPCQCLDIHDRLRTAGASGALLTGSGSAVFGIFESAETADQAVIRLENERLGRLYRCRTLSREESLCTTLSS